MTNNKWLAVLTVMLLLGFCPTTKAWGTTLVPMSDADLVQTSALIVVGTVRRIESVAVRNGRIFTEVTLGVERRVKGRLRSRRVVVTVPGGQVGKRFSRIYGAPEFTRGERVLVFLKRTPEGRLRTNALALGKYHVETTPTGGMVARRTVPTTDERPLDQFLADLGGRVPSDAGEQQPSGRVRLGKDQIAGRAVTDRFTYLTGTPYRWFPDTVSLGVANADSGLGQSATQTAIASAMAAWTNVAAASIVVQTGAGTTPARSVAGGVCDGVSSIQFDDPFSEVQDMTNCSGVLGVGGICGSGATMVVNGVTFRQITEGDVTMNNGMGACFGAANVAEVLTHEIGHAIGLGHSADADATMYAYAHFDGRGASVHTDDILGVTTIYPVATATTTTSSSTTTTSRTTTTSSSTTTTSRTTTTSSSTTTTSRTTTTSSSTTTTSRTTTTSSSTTTTSSTNTTSSSTTSTSRTTSTVITTSTTSVTTSSSTTVTQPAAPSTTTTESTSSTTTESTSSTSSTSTSSTNTTSTSTSTSSSEPVPTSTTTTLPSGLSTDADGDGVVDSSDACPDTPAGEMVDATGCSVCPCDAMPDGTPWASHTAYLRCVKGEARDRFAAAEFTRNDARDTVRQAMTATCGRPGVTRCCLHKPSGSTCRLMPATSCATQRPRNGIAQDIGPGSCWPNPCD